MLLEVYIPWNFGQHKENELRDLTRNLFFLAIQPSSAHLRREGPPLGTKLELGPQSSLCYPGKFLDDFRHVLKV